MPKVRSVTGAKS